MQWLLAVVLSVGLGTSVPRPAEQSSAYSAGQRPWAYNPDIEDHGVIAFKCQGSSERVAKYCRGPYGLVSI